MIDVRSRLVSIRKRMFEEGVDALYIQSAINRRYLSGFTGSAGAVLISEAEAWLFVDFRYVEQAKVESPEFSLVKVDDFLASLKTTLKKANLTRVAFEADHVSVRDYAQLKDKVPGIEWVPSEQWTAAVRGIKDASELKKMQRAIDCADAAFTHVLNHLAPGRTEKEIALELEFFMRREGAERLSFSSIVASGHNGALPHAIPTDRALQAGDLVTMDFGCIIDGYASDMTRTVAIKSADERAKEMYALVLQAQVAGVEAVRPGRTGKEVDAVARGIIEDAGYGEYFGHGLGHGIGLEVHEEFPRLSKRGEVELQPGMVCSVEPGVYIPGWGGIRIEDLVVVEPDGCRILTRSEKKLLIV